MEEWEGELHPSDNPSEVRNHSGVKFLDNLSSTPVYRIRSGPERTENESGPSCRTSPRMCSWPLGRGKRLSNSQRPAHFHFRTQLVYELEGPDNAFGQ